MGDIVSGVGTCTIGTDVGLATDGVGLAVGTAAERGKLHAMGAVNNAINMIPIFFFMKLPFPQNCICIGLTISRSRQEAQK